MTVGTTADRAHIGTTGACLVALRDRGLGAEALAESKGEQVELAKVQAVPQFRHASCVVAPEHACRGTDHLLVGHVANALAEPPTVTERVDDLAVALTPEHVAKRLVDLCAAVDGALPQAVDVVGR